MTNEIDIYDAKNLNYSTIKQFLKGGGSASDEELAMLLAISRNQNLNPFMKEVYFIKFGSQPAQIIVSRDAYRKRAQQNPNFKGTESGVIVMTENGTIEKLDGAFKAPKDQLIGAWARVHLKNTDVPVYVAVSYDEYVQKKDGAPNKMWASKPMTMLAKVAESQALRMAFPSEFSGTYSEEEFDIPKDVTDSADDGFNRMEQIKSGLSSAKNVEELDHFYNSLTDEEKKVYKTRFEDAKNKFVTIPVNVETGEIIEDISGKESVQENLGLGDF